MTKLRAVEQELEQLIISIDGQQHITRAQALYCQGLKAALLIVLEAQGRSVK